MVLPLATAPHPGAYLHWGVVMIGVTNAVIIAAMVLVFIVAAIFPIDRHRR